ncbi:hypothetical protein JCM21900_003256 [Sporobolomyces salmonicolor]
MTDVGTYIYTGSGGKAILSLLHPLLGRPSLNQVASSFPVILQAIRLGFGKLSHQRSTFPHRLLPRIVVVRAKTCRLLPTRSAASLSIVVRIIALEFNNRILSRLISSVQLDFFRFFRYFERCSVRIQLLNLNRQALNLSSSSVRLDFGLLVKYRIASFQLVQLTGPSLLDRLVRLALIERHLQRCKYFSHWPFRDFLVIEDSQVSVTTLTVTGYDVVTVIGVAAFSTSTPSSATATPPGAAIITPAPSSTIFASSAKTVNPGTSSPALNDPDSPTVTTFSHPSSASSASGQDFTSALAFPSSPPSSSASSLGAWNTPPPTNSPDLPIDSLPLNPESPAFPFQHAARNFISDRHFSPPFLDIADSFFNDLPNTIDLELTQLLISLVSLFPVHVKVIQPSPFRVELHRLGRRSLLGLRTFQSSNLRLVQPAPSFPRIHRIARLQPSRARLKHFQLAGGFLTTAQVACRRLTDPQAAILFQPISIAGSPIIRRISPLGVHKRNLE